MRRRRERTNVQKVAGKFHYRRRAALLCLRIFGRSTTMPRALGSPKGRIPSAPRRDAGQRSRPGEGRRASPAPARPASPGDPRRAPSRGCGKASRSAQFSRFPVVPAPALLHRPVLPRETGASLRSRGNWWRPAKSQPCRARATAGPPPRPSTAPAGGRVLTCALCRGGRRLVPGARLRGPSPDAGGGKPSVSGPSATIS